MSVIILPSRWQAQPGYPLEIDYSNPLVTGLSIAILPGVSIRNIVTGNTPTLTGTGTSKVIIPAYAKNPTAFGLGFDASSYYTYPTSSRASTNFNRGNRISVHARGAFTASGVIKMGNRGTNGWGLVTTGAGDVVQFDFVLWGVANQPASTTANFYGGAYGKPRSFGAVHQDNTTGGLKFYFDGLQLGSAVNTSAAGTGAVANWQFGADGSGSSGSNFNYEHIYVWDNVLLTDDAILELEQNPWQLFRKQNVVFYSLPPSSGVSGTVNYTNANDTSSASGTTTIIGTSSTTNANDTSAASGTTTVVGTLATTNADDSCSASGTVGNDVVGTVNYTNNNDTSSASGTTTVVGTSSTTNANDTSSASGTTTIVGTISITNADDSCSASGAAGTITGTVNYTNNNDTSSASGTSGIVSTGAGRSKKHKKHKWYLEIDGETFIVDSIEEAQLMLEQAERIAKEQAPIELKRAITIKSGVQIQTPKIKSTTPVKELQVLVKSTQKNINNIYAEIRRDYEIHFLLKMKELQDEIDDEEVIALLL